MSVAVRRLRIFHGLTNVAGIGGHLAAWQRAEGHNTVFAVYRQNAAFPNHDEKVFPAQEGSKLALGLLCLKTLLRHMFRYDIFNFYAGRSFLPGGLDLPLLRLLGKKIVMTYCGSEARLAEIEAQRNPFWHLIAPEFAGTLNDHRYDRRKRLALRWQSLWCQAALAPRDMYAPIATAYPEHRIHPDLWVHNLSAARAGIGATTLTSDPDSTVRIVHAPSSPRIKGTRFVQQAIETLRAEGLAFDYIELKDMPHETVLNTIASADIVIDQLLIGSFGSLAVEGMLLGRPVVSYAIDEIRAQHFPDSPMVNATVKNITDVLRDLVHNPDRRAALGADGPRFVRDHLDYDDVNRRLIDLYRSL